MRAGLRSYNGSSGYQASYDANGNLAETRAGRGT